MNSPKADVLRGTLDMLVLKTVALQPMHGLGISRRIQQITSGVFDVQPGSLFPALHRLEEDGWIEGEWGESENRRRAKYYRITRAGRRRLGEERQNWSQVVLAITTLLDTTET